MVIQGQGFLEARNDMIELKLGFWHLAGVDIVDVVVHKDAAIEVAVQDETRNAGNKDFGKKKK